MKRKKMKMNYSKKRLMKALKSIIDGKYKLCEASRIFKIPRQTLADKIKGRRPFGYCKPGPQSILGPDVETNIEKWLLDNAKLGFSLSKEGLQYSIKYILDQTPESVRNSIPFKNNTPGKGWFKSFRRRHPQVDIEYPENTTRRKPLLTDVDIRNWYQFIKEILDEKNCSYLLQNPNQIYVMNELMIAVNQNRTFSLVNKKKSLKIASRCYDENTFGLLVASNALGEFTPALITTKCSKAFDYFSNLSSEKWSAAISETCMTTSEIFYQYVTEILYPYLEAASVTFPIIVFVDGNFFCTSLPLTEFCSEKNIIFLGMPKTTSKYLNPLDAASGFPLQVLQRQYETKLRYDHSEEHPIVSLMDDMLTNPALGPYFVEQFKSCGLYPFRCDFEIIEPTEEIIKLDPLTEQKLKMMDYFESKITPEILQQFHDCKSMNSTWNGSSEYTALFSFWINTVKDLRESELIHDVLETNSENSQSLDGKLDAFIIEEEIEV